MGAFVNRISIFTKFELCRRKKFNRLHKQRCLSCIQIISLLG